MTRYFIRPSRKLLGVVWRLLLIFFASKFILFINGSVKNAYYFSWLMVVIPVALVSMDIMFLLFGHYRVDGKGIQMRIGRFQIKSFPWSEMKDIHVNRQMGAPISLLFRNKDGKGKFFGKEIERGPAFYEAILDKAAGYNGIEVTETHWP